MGSCRLSDVIQEFSLPFTVTISKPFITEDTEVLHANQKITVLHHEKIKLLTGVDKDGKTFHFNTLEKRNLFVDRVEVIDFVELVFPKKRDFDLRITLPEIYVVPNNQIEYYNSKIRKGEKFKFKPQRNQHFKDVNTLIHLISSDNKEIVLPLTELLKPGCFTFIRYIETVELQTFLTQGFVPQTIVFNFTSKEELPTEVVSVKMVREFDAILSVTEFNGKLIYEIFELSKEIKVSATTILVPPHVTALGKGTIYSGNINEIRFCIFYNIYNFYFYGRLEKRNFLNNSSFSFSSFGSQNKMRKCKSCSSILDAEEEERKKTLDRRKSFLPLVWGRLSGRKKETKIKKKVSNTPVYEDIDEVT